MTIKYSEDQERDEAGRFGSGGAGSGGAGSGGVKPSSDFKKIGPKWAKENLVGSDKLKGEQAEAVALHQFGHTPDQEALAAAVQQGEIPEDIRVWRVDEDWAETLHVGDTGEYTAPLVTSASYGLARASNQGYESVIVVEVPAGTHGIYLEPTADREEIRGEHEVMLERGLSYEVTSVESDPKTGISVVTVQILGSSNKGRMLSETSSQKQARRILGYEVMFVGEPEAETKVR